MDDGEIKNTVSQALRSDELLEASRISVTVEQGVVTLVGGVDSETKKQHAEAIARGVDGVESVVNELDVVLPLGDQRSDEEIARAAVLAVRLGAPGAVKVSVDDAGYLWVNGESKGYFAWDGDFDRCFFFDESGEFIEGYYLVGLLAEAFLRKSPGSRIVHDPRDQARPARRHRWE